MSRVAKAWSGVRGGYLWIFRRHSRVVAFIGAVIVFGTFVVKDVELDRWKDAVTTIDAAELQHRTQRRLNDLDKALSRIETRLEGLETTALNRRQHPLSQAALRQIEADATEEVELAAESDYFNASAELLDGLDIDDGDGSTRHQLARRWRALAVEISGERNLRRGDRERVVTTGEVDTAHERAMEHLEEELDGTEHEEISAVQASQEDLKQRASESMQLWQHRSWWLYGIGGVIGLLSRLAAVDDSDDDLTPQSD